MGGVFLKDAVCYNCMKSVDFVQQYCNRDLAHMQYCVTTFGVGNFKHMAKKLASYFGVA
jgi:predicted amidophosphoribosyltransferase